MYNPYFDFGMQLMNHTAAIVTVCPHCGRRISYFPGKGARCPLCKSKLHLGIGGQHAG